MRLKKISGSNELKCLEVADSKLYFSYERIIAYSGPEGQYRAGGHNNASAARHLALIGAIRWPVAADLRMIALASNAITSRASDSVENEKVVTLPSPFKAKQKLKTFIL